MGTIECLRGEEKGFVVYRGKKIASLFDIQVMNYQAYLSLKDEK
jgi:hypothetical protein